MLEPRFPRVVVKLIGQDGNAFNLIGLVIDALRKAKIDQVTIGEFRNEVTSGDYDHVLQTIMKWVTITGGEDDEYNEDDEYQD
jgi:hypothetical protein